MQLIKLLLILSMYIYVCYKAFENVKPSIKSGNCELFPDLNNECIEDEYVYGIASYYGGYYHNRVTANGEIFDKNKNSTASFDLPFGTLLEVTNLDNNKTVLVRVNDRGAFLMDSKGKVVYPLQRHPKRILDLSEHAFAQIGDLKTGLLNIKFKKI